MGDSPATQSPPDPPVAWDANIDLLLAGWCDNAKCFEWMHTEAYTYYQRAAQRFMISTNVLTAVSGVSNVIAGGLTVGAFQIAWIFGSISICVSTLNIIQDKLGYQQSAMTHKKLAGQWASIRTKIEEIIMIPYGGRRDCRTFLKFIKADINDAALEGNSIIPKDIRVDCYNRFKTVEDFEIPDVCGQVEHTRPYTKTNEEPLLPKTV
jgi:hypothetical protein